MLTCPSCTGTVDTSRFSTQTGASGLLFYVFRCGCGRAVRRVSAQARALVA